MSSFVEFCSALSEEKSKMSKQIRGRSGHLVFPIDPKNINLVDDVDTLLPVKVRCIKFSGFREVENVSANPRPGRSSRFPIGPKKKVLLEDNEISLPVKFPLILFSSFREEVRSVSANQRPGGHLVFPIGLKKNPHKPGRGRCDLASY